MVTDEGVLLPIGSTTWGFVYLARDLVAWEAPSAGGRLSRLSEFRELKEIMDGVFESMGEAIFALVPQETIRVAMRLKDKRRRCSRHQPN